MQHSNIMVIALRIRGAASIMVARATPRISTIRGWSLSERVVVGVCVSEKVSVESRCWYMNVLYPNKWTVVKNRGL